MRLLPSHDEPPQFARICRAFHMAQHLPSTTRRGLRVGLRDADGDLAATGLFDGYRQLAWFAQQLRSFGYRPVGAPEASAEFDCDALFAWPSVSERVDALEEALAA